MAEYNYIVSTGVIVPDTADTLATIQEEYKTAFGEDFNTDPSTPQGVLITAEVEGRNSVARNNAALANQINPNEAGGIFLASIWALTGGEPYGATKTIVQATINGAVGTVVDTTARASTSPNGDLFQPVNPLTIGDGGVATGFFQALSTGPIAAAAGTLTQIVNGPDGWETINNTDDGVLGVNQESDVASRLRRRNTLALQGMSLSEAITSALYDTEGVTSVSFRENYTDGPITIDGVTLVAHSIYICVAGGSDADVAAVLVNKKTGGTGYNGSTTASYIDPASGQTYNVLFDRPTPVPVVVRATVSIGTAPVEPVSAVKQAIMDYVTGALNGEPGFAIGASVSCFELSGAVNQEFPEIYVKNMETSLASPLSYSNAEIPIEIFQQATLTPSGIQVVVV